MMLAWEKGSILHGDPMDNNEVAYLSQLFLIFLDLVLWAEIFEREKKNLGFFP